MRPIRTVARVPLNPFEPVESVRGSPLVREASRSGSSDRRILPPPAPHRYSGTLGHHPNPPPVRPLLRRARRSSVRLTTILLLAALPALLPACAGRGRIPDDLLYGSITLRIVNRATQDVRIYLVRSGMRERLGQISAVSTEEIDLPMRRIGSDGTFQLYASPIGGVRSALSDVIQASAGQTVEWTLEADLARTSITVQN